MEKIKNWDKLKNFFNFENIVIILLVLIAILFIIALLFNYGILFLFAFFILLLAFILILKKIDYRFPLVFFSIVIAVVSIMIYQDKKDSNFIIAGFTLVMILITTWYAYSTDKQYKLSEKQYHQIESEKKGKFIAEISRSIFSPLLNCMYEAKEDLNIRPNFCFITEVRTMHWENYSPKIYLQNTVNINTNIENNINLKRIIRRPVNRLLKIEDESMNYFLPKIQQLSDEFEKKAIQNEIIAQSIQKKIFSIKEDFYNYCITLDSSLSRFSSEMTIPLLFNTSLYKLDLSFLDKNLNIDELIYEFLYEHMEEVHEWIINNEVIPEFKKLLLCNEKLMNLIDDLIDTIEKLQYEWKINYFLTEEDLQVGILKGNV